MLPIINTIGSIIGGLVPISSDSKSIFSDWFGATPKPQSGGGSGGAAASSLGFNPMHIIYAVAAIVIAYLGFKALTK